MDRLTVPDELIEGGKRVAIIDARAVREEAMAVYWALKKYEDTGLTPEEIMDGRMLTGWIPVTERLPEYDGMYLACFDDGFVTAIAYEAGTDGTQDWELRADSGEVTAWMPLPEPYREDAGCEKAEQ